MGRVGLLGFVGVPKAPVEVPVAEEVFGSVQQWLYVGSGLGRSTLAAHLSGRGSKPYAWRNRKEQRHLNESNFVCNIFIFISTAREKKGTFFSLLELMLLVDSKTYLS